MKYLTYNSEQNYSNIYAFLCIFNEFETEMKIIIKKYSPYIQYNLIVEQLNSFNEWELYQEEINDQNIDLENTEVSDLLDSHKLAPISELLALTA